MLRAFLDPKPRIKLGRELSRLNLASAMIDISDGLSVDLAHMCEESDCGAEVYLDKLPVSPELKALQRRAYDFALNGGEDYQLLFSVSDTKLAALSKLNNEFGFYKIGKIIEQKGIFVVDRPGRRKKLHPNPWHHF
jgi:thiamine-monophosphate kinase